MEREQNPDLKPGIDVHKRTTKVNLGVVIGVVVFLAITIVAVVLYQRNPDRTANEQRERVESSP